MKPIEKNTILSIPVLLFIYLLLCILTTLFFRSFVSEILMPHTAPNSITLIVFLILPLMLFLFFAVTIVDLLKDIIVNHAALTFQMQLLVYFLITILFVIIPILIITALSISGLSRFWHTVSPQNDLEDIHNFALDVYSLHSERFKQIIYSTHLNSVESIAETPEHIGAIQDFVQNEQGAWETLRFIGKSYYRIANPVFGQQGGFLPRDIPRDIDTIRYAVKVGTVQRIISYELGTGFDTAIAALEQEKKQFEIINTALSNAGPLFFLYCLIFLSPIVLLTMLIAISFTRKLTQPLTELALVTQRLAEGDFSIHIISNRKDELGLLIRSFNSMVHALEESRHALLKTEKISLWQRMAAQLAHEIKNPLTPIKLSAERVLHRFRAAPERIDEILEEAMLAIIQEVDGLALMLSEFRTLSQPGEPSLTSTHIKELIEEIIKPYSSSYPEVKFSIENLVDMTVHIDKRRLSQVLTNLIINAIDAMQGTGTIEMRTDAIIRRSKQFCRFSIHDTGQGISSASERQIFIPYFTTKETGTGLGLPIVERIVHDHGGIIWFDSEEGVGTTFFVDMPADESD
ncbi:MAG: HAMP domain-containing protein [Spirochaetaceae bacterium]|nr:HAMP domain-containing protein [Spirochaetaceae bacterium]